MVPALSLMDIAQAQNPIKAELDIDHGIISPKTNVIGLASVAKNEQTFHDISTPWGPEDVEVDINTYKNNNEVIAAEMVDPDATEYSSSFGNTFSDAEKFSGLSENEVESQFFDDSDLASPYDAFGSIFQTRKKKLTNHWRNFIRPIMWRCKWTELKLKQLRSQSLKYSRELAANEQRKHSQNCQSTSDGFSSKAMPFSNQYYRRKAAKRRRRKRIEEKTDTTSYISHHTLFSYLENKKLNPDSSSMMDDFENREAANANYSDKFGIDNDEISLEFKESNNSIEQVLQKIEMAQSRLQKMKNRLDSVISKNPCKFSSYESLSNLGQTSSAPTPTISAGNADSAGAIINAANQILDFDFDDLMIPDSAVSSYEEAIHVPDIIESTVGLLAAADVTIHQPETGNSCEDILDNLLIHNEEATTVEEDGPGLIGVNNQVSRTNQEQEQEQEQEQGKDEEGESANPIGKSSTEAQGQSVLKSCLESDFQFQINKRKRGERKAGPVGWNKKSSGEPDSQ